MIVGLPQGLFFYKYNQFFKTFFEKLNVELIISENTNKTIIQQGLGCCTSEACLPIKVFHGHVESLKNRCDLIVIPRIIKVKPNDYLCPHLCSMPEMILHSIEDLPQITHQSLYFNSQKQLYNWALSVGKDITRDKSLIESAFYNAMITLLNDNRRINQSQFKYKILLLGHDYLIHDQYISMNIIKKLNAMDIGIITADYLSDYQIETYMHNLPRKPFWYFYRQAYGSSSFLSNQKTIDGIIFLSSFGCGIDAIISEVIKEDIINLPLLMIKIDEHTGDAGLDTRLEAFFDMLEYRFESRNYGILERG